MNLLVTKTTKNKIVTIELTTAGFTCKENQMLDQLGEPIITIEETYGQNVIKFSKKIRSGFKVKVKFDANLEDGTEKTADYIEQFLDSVQEQMEAKMEKLEEEFEPELMTSKESRVIKY